MDDRFFTIKINDKLRDIAENIYGLMFITGREGYGIGSDFITQEIYKIVKLNNILK